ncbi:FAD/NAD(P)-binding domain-containing protein [Lentithecium fluviatile CBS 122367]|uniref:FAD/NAD(P)-binding domain-containing protein n=1 Tax=Lentithecium fluviatile CBS 122367 TaxID=1168545 RepID=A0A6G1JMU6_9PLEO|nr:FAD/NAD(P)-binding domain-containing protein [Lentithecium fluviatile CBS 122367]
MSESTPSSRKNIVILGGSYAGISVAHYVLKHAIPTLPQTEAYQVVIISSASEAMCRPACPRALISDDMFPQEKLFVSIPKQFEQYPEGSFRFVHGSATAVDHDQRMVTVRLEAGKTETLKYHTLVVATGASTPSPLFGLNRDEAFLKEAWVEFRSSLATAKRIVIAGGGPAGVETAGELGEYLNGRAGFLSSQLDNPKVSITVVTAGSNILPALRPSIAKTAEQYLAKVGVTVIKNTRVKGVSPPNAGADSSNLTTGATIALDDGSSLEADLFIPATGMTPNTSFLSQILLTSTGQVNTNLSTLRVDAAGPRVYALGDVSSSARPAVHNILAAVPVVGANIKRDLLLAAGKSESEVNVEKLFKEDKRETQMVPIGKSKGVGAAMGWKLPSWMVWAIKGRDYWLWTTGGLWSGKQWAKESK